MKDTNNTIKNNTEKAAEILKKFMEQAVKAEKEKTLNINTLEGMMGEAIGALKDTVGDMSGEILDNADITEIEAENCKICGKKLKKNKK